MNIGGKWEKDREHSDEMRGVAKNRKRGRYNDGKKRERIYKTSETRIMIWVVKIRVECEGEEADMVV